MNAPALGALDALPRSSEWLIAGRQPRTTGRYAHLSDDPLRQASDAIGARIAAALERKPASPVIPLRSRESA